MPTTDEAQGTQTPPDPADVRARAMELVLAAAQEAAKSGDVARFDALLSRILTDGQAIPLDDSTDHERKLDRWRVRMTVIMVAALAVIIGFATALQSNAGQYVSLFSGLAGIALGWLFGGGATSVRRSSTTSSSGTSDQTSSRRTTTKAT